MEAALRGAEDVLAGLAQLLQDGKETLAAPLADVLVVSGRRPERAATPCPCTAQGAAGAPHTKANVLPARSSSPDAHHLAKSLPAYPPPAAQVLLACLQERLAASPRPLVELVPPPRCLELLDALCSAAWQGRCAAGRAADCLHACMAGPRPVTTARCCRGQQQVSPERCS